MSPKGRRPRVELICVGTELLSGQINTHQGYLAAALAAAGLPLAAESSLPDDRAELARAVKEALGRCDALLLCGGLGPTFDDITREAAADALGRGLRYRPALFAKIERMFFRYRLPVPEENKRQAEVIDGARVLANAAGSAPGQLIARRRAGAPQLIALMPGPFAEMSPMFERQVLPALRRTFGGGRRVASLCVRMAGVPESVADEKLAALTRAPKPGESFTILAGAGQVDFHAVTTAASQAQAARALRGLRSKIYQAVGEHIFGEGPQTLEAAVGGLLRRGGLKLAVAESCTAGLVAARLTNPPGSSDYFAGGVIAYANDVKSGLLDVSPRTLARHGAVSAQCAREMAEGVRRRCRADLGLSLTGIAGPGGATKGKPVGLVFMALSSRDGTHAFKHRFSGDRAAVRARASAAALNWLWRHLRSNGAKEHRANP